MGKVMETLCKKGALLSGVYLKHLTTWELRILAQLTTAAKVPDFFYKPGLLPMCMLPP